MKKKKKYYLGTFILVVAIVLLGYYNFRSTNGYRSSIPVDAKAVMEIDLAGLAQDCGFTVKDFVSHYDKLDDTGLDFSKPVYGFLTKTGNFGLLAAVSDGEELDESLQDLGFDTEKQRGMIWSNVGSWMLVRDNSKVLVMGPTSVTGMDALREEMADLMIQGDSESPILLSLDEEVGHVKFVSMLSALPEKVTEHVANQLPKGADLSSMKIVSGLSTKDNKLTWNIRLQSYDERLMAELRKFNESLRPIKGNLMSDAPADPVVWLGCSTDGAKLLKELRKNPTIREKLVMANMCVDADQMLQAIDGDVSFSIPYLKLGTMDYLFTAEIKNASFLAEADDWKEGLAVDNGMKLSQLSNNDFHVSYSDINAYFGTCKQNKVLYVTNSSDLQKTAGTYAVSNTYQDLKDKIVGCIFFSSINLSRILYAISPYTMIFGPNQRIYKIMNSLDRLNIKVPDCTEFTVELTLKDNIKAILLD